LWISDYLPQGYYPTGEWQLLVLLCVNPNLVCHVDETSPLELLYPGHASLSHDLLCSPFVPVRINTDSRQSCFSISSNIKIAIFKDNCPEDKLTEDKQDLILEELGRVFHETLKGVLPLLRSFRLEGGTFMYVCADQQSGQ
jgi:hypothetical protein